MSRSIHKTRRQLYREARANYADPVKKGEALEALREALQTKRRIKWQVREERRGQRAEVPPPTPIESIPIAVEDTPHVYYAAEVGDVRAVLKLLPPGVCDGLTSIRLGVGQEEQRRDRQLDDSDSDFGPDPVIGRLGTEVLPGVYRGSTAGIYFQSSAKIELYGFVRRDGTPLPRWWKLLLRLQMLSTLVHEVGHHVDFTSRVARGRWRADESVKLERYAEHRQGGWVREHAIPYLEQTYPDQVRELQEWSQQHLGVRVTLADLEGVSEVAWNGPKVAIIAIGGPREALCDFVRDTARGVAVRQARLDFALWASLFGPCGPAIAVLEQLAGAAPDDMEVISDLAREYVNAGQHELALPWVRRALSIDPKHVSALRTLAEVHAKRKEWREVLAVVEQIRLGTSGRPDDFSAKLLAEAQLALGDQPAALAAAASVRSGLARKRLLKRLGLGGAEK